MFSKKTIITIFIYMPIVFTIFASCFYLTETRKITFYWNGFGLDSSDTFYVGKTYVIEKYRNGELVGTIYPQTTRAYAFTIQDNDTILLSTSDTVYTMDTSGNILSQWEDEDTKTFTELDHKRKFLAADGKTYYLKGYLFRTKIISSDGTVLYQMPLEDYLAKIICDLAYVSVFIVPSILIYKLRHPR